LIRAPADESIFSLLSSFLSDLLLVALPFRYFARRAAANVLKSGGG